MVSETFNLVPMGYVAGPFGINGWIKIKISTESPESLSKYKTVYFSLDDGAPKAYKIEQFFVGNGVFHAKLHGIADRDMAMSLRGAKVLVDREQFPQLTNDEYYWIDLIGLTVLNRQNTPLGVVSSLMETGANDVLVVKANEKADLLIPFVGKYIDKVDLINKQIIADWELDY